MFLSAVLFALGHIISALLVYFNHRFVFHGKLGKLPILSNLRLLHIEHHRHAYDEKRNEHFEPIWVTLSLFSVIALVGLYINIPLACGMASFAAVYAYRHKRIHNKDKDSFFSIHHRYHHTRNAKRNFSGVYPVIDRIFGTYEESRTP